MIHLHNSSQLEISYILCSTYVQVCVCIYLHLLKNRGKQGASWVFQVNRCLWAGLKCVVWSRTSQESPGQAKMKHALMDALGRELEANLLEIQKSNYPHFVNTFRTMTQKGPFGALFVISQPF